MRVADVMQKDAVTFSPDQTLVEVEEVLVRRKITGAPVVESGRVVGVISRSDLVRQLELERSRIEDANQAFDPFDREDPFTAPRTVSMAVASRWVGLRVKDAMHSEVVDISPDESINEAARRMAEHRIHRLAVIEGERLVGVVSTLDVLRAIGAQSEG